MVDTDFKIIVFNNQFQKLYSTYFCKEIKKGDCILESAQPARKEIVKQIYLRVFTGETLESEVSFPATDKSIHFFYNKFKPAYDEYGKIIGAFVTVTDITEKKKFDKQLVINERRYRALVENGNDAVGILSSEAIPFFASPAVETVLGYKEEEILQADVLKLIHPEDIEEVLKSISVAMENPGVPVPCYICRVLHKNGSWRWIESTLTNMLHDPAIAGIVDNFRDVTDKKLAEEKIRVAKERYDIVVKATNEAVWDWDIISNDVHWDEAFRSLFGYDPEKEITNIHAWDACIHPDDAQRVIDSVEEIRQSVETSQWQSEYRFLKSNGEYANVLDRGFVIRDTVGKPIRMIGAMQDITDKVQSDQALRISERQLSVATHLAKLGYWEFNIIEGIFTFNDHFYSILKTNAEEMGGYTMRAETYVARFLHPDDSQLVQEEMKLSIETTDPNYSRNIEHRVIYPNGETGYLAVRFFIVKDKNNRTIKAIGANQDITDRKMAEQQLTLSKERYDMVAKATNDVIYEWDIVNNISYWNDAYETLFGHKKTGDAMSPDTYLLNLHPDDKQELLESVYAAFSTKKTSMTRELRFRCADGNYKTVFDKLIILYDKNNKPVKIVGAMQDITERKKNEIAIKNLNDQLNKRAEELAASNTELENFAYVASHDLQEPLRMVSSFLQLLEKKYKNLLDESATQYIEYAVDGADRMKRLILDLLEYSRVNTNQELRTKVDISEIINLVINTYGAKINESKAIIKMQLMPSIDVNSTQMTQLFQNLVGNALKYNKSAVPEIEIGCEEKEHAWQFFVKDNGIGIDPKFFDRVFIIFQRLHTKNQFSGTGIGLAICKKIVEKHGGRIWIESAPGKGSTFFFTIKK